MRWVRYVSQGNTTPRCGVLEDGMVHALEPGITLIELLGDDGQRLAEAGERALRDPAELVAADQVQLLAPLAKPPAIRDGLCFLDHLRNIRRALGVGDELLPVWQEIPAFYFANPASVVGPYDDVAVPPGCTWFDLELEVAAVIGRAGRDLHPDRAEAHIAGYMLLCDWSARDLQFKELPLGIGQAKGKDSATTLGPMLVTADELEPFRRDGRLSIELRATVNGEELTKGRLDQMDWTFGDLLAYASRGTELAPGDVFGSGTVPGGCLLEHVDTPNPADFGRWLRPGDVVSLSGEGLGETRQRVVPGQPVHPLRSGH
jgi:2-keto-4-pentenoate hydratase/2-oxohepta-3-ene-1,7-dioic acid hydratase in catechol pathway